MAKLERLGWAHGTAFGIFGTRIGVRSSDPSALEEIRRRLPVPVQPARGPVVDHLLSLRIGGGGRGGVRRFHLLYADARQLARTHDLEEVFETAEQQVERFLAERARGYLFVHAGAVAWRGRGILLPGPSRSGKTTLVEALVRAGAEYYSDEYAVLDREGRLQPWPRPLARREGSEVRRLVPVESIGGTRGTRPVAVGLLAATEYGASRAWRPVPLSRGRGVLELLAHTVAARPKPAFTCAVLARALGQARVLKGARGEARATADALLEAAAGLGGSER